MLAGRALWPVAQRADAFDHASAGFRCLQCPTPGVCEASGHAPATRVMPVESAEDVRGESS